MTTAEARDALFRLSAEDPEPLEQTIARMPLAGAPSNAKGTLLQLLTLAIVSGKLPLCEHDCDVLIAASFGSWVLENVVPERERAAALRPAQDEIAKLEQST